MTSRPLCVMLGLKWGSSPNALTSHHNKQFDTLVQADFTYCTVGTSACLSACLRHRQHFHFLLLLISCLQCIRSSGVPGEQTGYAGLLRIAKDVIENGRTMFPLRSI